MIVDNIKVNINGMEIEVSRGTTLLEISKMFKTEGRRPIIAKVNGEVSELSIVANDNDEIEFYDVTNSIANRVYVNGLVLLLNYAFNEIYHGKNVITVKHSVDKSLCLETSDKITKAELNTIEKKMQSVVDANLPITKMTVLKSEAIDYIDLSGLYNKIETKNCIIYFNQDEIREKYKDVINPIEGIPYGYNKLSCF